MVMNMGKGYKAGVLLLVLSIALLGGCGKADGEERAKQTEGTGQAAEQTEQASTQIDFEGQDIEGNAVTSAVFSESKLTMVNIWATYCNPCLREMPGLGELAGEYSADEFQIIGIISDVQEGAEQKVIDYAEDLIEQTGADYPHLLLNQSLYNALLTDVSAVPTTFFIDKEGNILDTVIGSMEKSAWEDRINALLEKQ